jgi:4-phosphopantoate--beta-alanine ligase
MTEESAPAEVDDETELPADHPRYEDLVSRHRIEAGVEKGITHLQGMHAEGRGSTFDYLLGEETIPSADEAARAAAAHLLLADHPVLSINGNVAALVPSEIVELADVVDAGLEVNLFNRTEQRVQAIAAHLREHGAQEVLGVDADATLPNLDHERATVDSEGIAAADVVLVPLEDGDRAEALDELGKTEIVVDLNPLSRSPQVADVPIVDNVLRAVPNVTEHARALATADRAELESIVDEFDPEDTLDAAEKRIRSSDWD